MAAFNFIHHSVCVWQLKKNKEETISVFGTRDNTLCGIGRWFWSFRFVFFIDCTKIVVTCVPRKLWMISMHHVRRRILIHTEGHILNCQEVNMSQVPRIVVKIRFSLYSGLLCQKRLDIMKMLQTTLIGSNICRLLVLFFCYFDKWIQITREISSITFASANLPFNISF